MSITKINLNESNKLEFELSIQGANIDNSTSRFCIVTEDKEYVFTGKLGLGKVDFSIPVLENILDAGLYKCRMEVIVGNNYFVPINDNIEFMAPIPIKEVKIKSTYKKKILIETKPKVNPDSKVDRMCELAGINPIIQEEITIPKKAKSHKKVVQTKEPKLEYINPEIPAVPNSKVDRMCELAGINPIIQEEITIPKKAKSHKKVVQTKEPKLEYIEPEIPAAMTSNLKLNLTEACAVTDPKISKKYNIVSFDHKKSAPLLEEPILDDPLDLTGLRNQLD